LHHFILLIITHQPPSSTLFPYTTLFRSRCRRSRPVRGSPRSAFRTPTAARRTLMPGGSPARRPRRARGTGSTSRCGRRRNKAHRSEEHTSELQSLAYLVCRLLLEKKKK